jgi:hypothetical protein
LKPETTQQSGQTPDKAVEIKNFTVYVSGYNETDTTGMLSPLTDWRQQSEFVSRRQSCQILAAVRKVIRVSLEWTKRLSVQMWPHVPAMYTQTNVGLLCCVGSGSKVAVP